MIQELRPLRIHSVDGLRGMASLLVVIFHLQNYFSAESFFQSGYLSVDLFFVISGFILTTVYSKNIETRTLGFGEFFQRRFARLWPLQVFSLFLMVTAQILLKDILHLSQDFSITNTPFTFFLNLGLIQGLGLGPLSWNFPSWSVSTELFVSFLWFGLIWYRKWSPVIAFAAVIIPSTLLMAKFSAFNVPPMAYIWGLLTAGFLRTLVGFSMGCFVYWFNQKYKVPCPDLLVGFGIASMIAIGCLQTAPRTQWDFAFVTVVFPLLLLGVLNGSISNRIFSSKPLYLLGECSYSLYLLHNPIATILGPLANSIGFRSLPELGFIILAIILLISFLSYNYLEKPLNHWLKGYRFLEKR